MSETYGDQIECPYCGYVHGESWEYGVEDDEYTCMSCEKTSDLSVYVSIRYSLETKEHAYAERLDSYLRIRDSCEPRSDEWVKWNRILADEKSRGVT